MLQHYKIWVKGKIISAKTGGKSFSDVVYFVEKTKSPEVILMLDFDRRGEEGTKRIKQDLEKIRIRPNTKFWYDLSCLTGEK